MLDTKPQPTPTAAFTRLMWAWAFATARVADAFAARGVAWWSQVLRPAVEPPRRPAESEHSPSPGGEAPAAVHPRPDGPVQPPPAAEPPAPPADAAFANYRSAGGHAAAQVIVGPNEVASGELAGTGETAASGADASPSDPAEPR